MCSEIIDEREQIVVTCGLPYVNGPMHVAHLRTYVPADMYVRFLRKLGKRIVFVCGSDTHGSPITVEAEKRGITPKQLVEIYHEHYQRLFRELSVEFDNYGSTDDPINHRLAQDFVRANMKKGLIYPKEAEFPYCPKEERFLPDRYVVGVCPHCGTANVRGDECDIGCGRYLAPGEILDPHCAICRTPAVMKRRTHYFFRLSAFSDFLKSYLKHLRGTQIATKYALTWLRAGLRDWCITRDLYWGVKFPDETDLVVYVWWDAPIGYISSTIEWSKKKGGDWEHNWKGKGKIVHFIGPGIIYHHCLFWPSMLKGADFNLPWAIVSSAAVKIEDKPFSKTRGNVVWVEEDFLKMGFETDSLRYYILSYTDHTRDLNFSWQGYQAKVNGELVATLGNFVYRTLVFTHRHWGRVPEGKLDDQVKEKIDETISRVTRQVVRYHFKRAIDDVLNLASFGNKYLQDHKPWDLVKTDRAKCADVIYNCLQITKALAILFEPIMPKKAELLWRQLGEKGSIHDARIDESREALKPNKLTRPHTLFPKVSDEKIESITRVMQRRLKSNR